MDEASEGRGSMRIALETILPEEGLWTMEEEEDVDEASLLLR